MFEALANGCGDSTPGIVIACLGLSFKADIDDRRKRLALAIAENIVGRHLWPVISVEPEISEFPASLVGVGVNYCWSALVKSDLLMTIFVNTELQVVSRNSFSE